MGTSFYRTRTRRSRSRRPGSRTLRSRMPIGINYEGGKIIKHVMRYEGCLAYANCQFVMEAPYDNLPRIAPEPLHAGGPSEIHLPGYDEGKIMAQLSRVFKHINNVFNDSKVVIQVSRNKTAANQMFKKLVEPILKGEGIKNYQLVTGYKEKDYFKPSGRERFVFVNIGMFSDISDTSSLKVGDLCNPVISYNIMGYNHDNGFIYTDRLLMNDNRNILLRMPFAKKITLFGLMDNMPPVVPDMYFERHIRILIDRVRAGLENSYR